MTLIRRNENLPVLSGFLNDFFRNDWLDFANKNFSGTNTTLPSVNIKETKESFEVEMAAPGLNKNDFKISLNRGIMTISSEKNTENETKEGEYTRREFSYQSFCRSFSLPESADYEKVGAKYENGLLVISIPKKEEEKIKAERTIEIQ
jgi:HSP20 family protein